MYKTIFSLSIVVLGLSCTDNPKQVPNEKPKEENPVALQENKSDIISFKRGYGDLVNEIYDEIASKSEELKQLENDIKVYHSEAKGDKLKDNFNTYNNKSETYYRSAEAKLANLSDSILRKKIIDIVKKSSSQYTGKIAEIEGLISEINKKELSIEDYHTVSKIVKTLPVIEKYQKDNLPNTKEFKDHIAEQEKLLQKIKSIIEK